jgi:hypothetical protein
MKENINMNKLYTLFVGYDIPAALDHKHRKLLPVLDEHYPRIDLEGDDVHVIPEKDIEFIQNILGALNEIYDFNLTADIEPYE